MKQIIPPKRPVRFFNTTGPCFPWDHYMLPPEERLIGAQLDRYVCDSLYWVLHAPRQTGKTTFLQSWMREINAGDEAVACYVSLETSSRILDVETAMPLVCESIIQQAQKSKLPEPKLSSDKPGYMVNDLLSNWAKKIAPKALVLLFDEVDCLESEPIISFLRQLRDGFLSRGIGKFPVSVALVGMRDLDDYNVAAKGGGQLSPYSPFNIKIDSVLLGNFSKDDVQKLFAQRTEETGQQITDDALNYVWEQSRGQPWIVNALFERVTMRILKSNDYSTVTLEHVQTAREQMILARETHLGSLVARLEEPGIRKVMEAFFTGTTDPNLTGSDGFRKCVDCGLVRIERGTPVVTNPIYREVLARQITFGMQTMLPEPEWQWEKPDGSLDMDALLSEFQKFWRRNSAVWEQKSDYTEAFPHLLLMAFLQRILNGGGGRIEREYAAGRGRMDLSVEYNNKIYIIEIKLIRDYDTPEYVLEEGLTQIARYRDRIDSAAPAYLVIFDRRAETKTKPWDERLSRREENGITVVGC